MSYGIGAVVNETLNTSWPGYKQLGLIQAADVAQRAIQAYRYRARRTDALKRITDVRRFVQLWCELRQQRDHQAELEAHYTTGQEPTE